MRLRKIFEGNFTTISNSLTATEELGDNMKQQYKVLSGKYEGLTTKAETLEQAKKNINAQIKRRESKLTELEKDLIHASLDLACGDWGYIVEDENKEPISPDQAFELYLNIIKKLKL